MVSGERKKIIAVIGSANTSTELAGLAFKVGKTIIDRGYRLANGGMSGVMEHSAQGALISSNYSEGSILGVLPGYDSRSGNQYSDITIPTGAGVARNTILMSICDVVIALDGGAGTLSEIALAWQLKKMIVCLGDNGWHKRLESLKIDERRSDQLFEAKSPEDALDLISRKISDYRKPFKGVEKRKASPVEGMQFIRRHFSTEELTQIGGGSEGYIYQDAEKVFKYFHSGENLRGLYWQMLALSEKMNKSTNPHFFNFNMVFESNQLLVYYKKFESTSYIGGHETEVIAFLRAMNSLDWVMTNFKAANFRINSSGRLVCIDLGKSFYPKSEVLFRKMCMRAYLTIHFPVHQQINKFYSYTNTKSDFNIISEIGADSKTFLEQFEKFYQKIIFT